jgi:Zn-dependent peptidase ImmA (M78 family)
VSTRVGTLKTLGDVREKLLGYGREAVARMTHIPVERLKGIETGVDVPSIFEVEALAQVYGIEAEQLAEDPIRLTPGDGVVTLASLNEFRDLDDVTRARVVAAANAARDMVRLRKVEGAADVRATFRQEAPTLKFRSQAPSFRQGAEAASDLRRKMGLKDQPIESLRDLVRERFPSVSVMFANLGGGGPAGLSFLDHLRGPAIVLNLEGKNKNASVRRFSLAHELGHLLLDWNRNQPLAMISGYLNESRLDVERRANAFAVRFLCPEAVIRKVGKSADLSDPKFGKLLGSFGLSYPALRLYLRNEAGRELPEIPPPALSSIGTEARLIAAEEPTGVSGFPLDEVPPERRSDVARLASQLYSTGRLRRDQFASFIGVTPAADLESVLDFYALNVPAPDASASVA